MKKLSRDMYKDIPYGGYLFTADKIAFKIKTERLNMIGAKRWFKDNPIGIVVYGHTSFILIHAEFQPNQRHLGRRCFNAILYLLFDCVFSTGFSLILNNFIKTYFSYLLLFDFFTVMFIKMFFTLADWENAIDFLDVAPFAFINTDVNNPKSFRVKKGTTFYSKDWSQKHRNREVNGEVYTELKSVQKSVVCGYDKSKTIDCERPIFRIETKSQGKYSKDLKIEHLDGTVEEAFVKMLPTIRKNIKKVIAPNALKLAEPWKEAPPEPFKRLFLDEE